MTFGLKRNIVFFNKKLFAILLKKYKLHVQFFLKKNKGEYIHQKYQTHPLEKKFIVMNAVNYNIFTCNQ